MATFKIKSWDDYRIFYEDLINSLKADNKEYIVIELKEAQKYVNGMTDGWHVFLAELTKTINSNNSKMTKQQLELADFLKNTLSNILNKR